MTQTARQDEPGLSAAGLPPGLPIACDGGGDAHRLRVARRVEGVVGFAARP